MRLGGIFDKKPCVVYCKGEVIAEFKSQHEAAIKLNVLDASISNSITRGTRFSIIHNGKKVMAVARYKR